MSASIRSEDLYSDIIFPSLSLRNYDCQIRKKLQRYSLVAVDEWDKSTSQDSHNVGLVNLFTRATPKEILAFFVR